MKLFNELEAQHGLPNGLLKAVMQQESGGNTRAVSPKGARGAFQFMPATAKQYGVDVNDLTSSAKGAAKMYADLLNQNNGDLNKALAGYNWGQGNVQRKGLDAMPVETKQYIQKVTANMQPQIDKSKIVWDEPQIDKSQIKWDEAPQQAPQVARNVAPGLIQRTNETTIDTLAALGKGVGDVGLGAQKYLGKFANAIGADTVGEWLVNDAEQGRKKLAGELAPHKARSPIAAPVGEVAGNIAATLPVGGMLGAVAGKAGMPAVATALRTGGFRTGLPAAKTTAGRVGNMALRSGAGAAVGGISAGLVNEDSVGLGATIGGVLPPVVAGIGKAGYAAAPYLAKPFQITDELMLPGGKRRAAGRLINDLAGEKTGDVVNALRNAPNGVTAGQAIVPTGSAEMAALQKFANSQRPSEYVAIDDAQELARRNLLASVTPDLQGAIRSRGDVTGPMRQAELNAANTAGIQGNKLAEAIQQKSASRGDALNSAGRLYGWGTQQQQIINNKLAKTPGWVKPETINRFNQNIDGATSGSKLAYDVSKQRGAEQGFKQYQLDSIAAHGMSPLKSDKILGGVDKTLNAPGTRASDVAQKSLGYVRDKIASLTNERGVIDARDLYTVRKEIGNAVSQFAKESGNWDKRMVSGIQTEIQKSIDDAIEGAGGTGWKSYLAKFGEMSRPIDQSKVLGEMSSVLAKPGGGERVTPFLNVLGRGEQALLKKSTGFPRYQDGDLSKVLSLPQMSAVDDIGNQLTRDMRLDYLAKEGTPAMLNKLRLSQEPATLPGLLNPKITVANAILRRLQGAGGEAVNKEIARLMLPQNKVLLAEVISKATPQQYVMLNNAMKLIGPTLYRSAPLIAADQ